MKTVLITGGAGFVGSHCVEGVLKETDWNVVILDRLDIAGNLERLSDMEIWEQEKHRVKFIWWDLKAPLNVFVKKELKNVNYIWHLAASSHVDRSIEDPLSFVQDNVVGTCNMLNYAREVPPDLFIYFSTDEVFGPAPEGVYYKEWDRYKSGNPYAATKAGAEELCIAYQNTYRLPIIVTHTMNVFGERQHPEKFIPMTIRKILNDETVLIHSDSKKETSGSRCWIHSRNVFDALLFLTEKHKDGDKYNIVGEEKTNLEIAQMIAKIVKKPLKHDLVDFHSSRPGHDLRYALDGTKLKEMGFEYKLSLADSFQKTIQWMVNHDKWLH